MIPSYETDLFILQCGFPPQSARGCIQTLKPIPQGTLQRTINGNLIYVGNSSHHKYHTIVQCTDKNSPGFQGVWRGSSVDMGCLIRLNQVIGKEEDSVLLSRPPVDGSLLVYDETHEPVEFTLTGDRVSVHRQTSSQETLFLTYRPFLSLLIQDFHLQTHEWGDKEGGGGVRWVLEALEI